MLKSYTNNTPKTKPPCAVILCLLPLLLLGFFGAALGAGLSLGSNIYSHLAVVAAARWACAVRDTHSAALALNEGVGNEGMVRTAVSRVRPCMSHPDNHAPNLTYLFNGVKSAIKGSEVTQKEGLVA